jgi:hypothetical protein
MQRQWNETHGRAVRNPMDYYIKENSPIIKFLFINKSGFRFAQRGDNMHIQLESRRR